MAIFSKNPVTTLLKMVLYIRINLICELVTKLWAFKYSPLVLKIAPSTTLIVHTYLKKRLPISNRIDNVQKTSHSCGASPAPTHAHPIVVRGSVTPLPHSVRVGVPYLMCTASSGSVHLHTHTLFSWALRSFTLPSHSTLNASSRSASTSLHSSSLQLSLASSSWTRPSSSATSLSRGMSLLEESVEA